MLLFYVGEKREGLLKPISDNVRVKSEQERQKEGESVSISHTHANCRLYTSNKKLYDIISRSFRKSKKRFQHKNTKIQKS